MSIVDFKALWFLELSFCYISWCFETSVMLNALVNINKNDMKGCTFLLHYIYGVYVYFCKYSIKSLGVFFISYTYMIFFLYASLFDILNYLCSKYIAFQRLCQIYFFPNSNWFIFFVWLLSTFVKIYFLVHSVMWEGIYICHNKESPITF